MKNLIIFIMAAALTAGCGKYPEGPEISLKSKRKRLEGTYKATEFRADDVNLLYYEQSGITPTSCGPTIPYNELFNTTLYQWQFTRDGEVHTLQAQSNVLLDYQQTYDNCLLAQSNSNEIYQQHGTWDFYDNKKSIIVSFPGNPEVEMRIIELRDDVLRFTWNAYGSTFYLTLSSE